MFNLIYTSKAIKLFNEMELLAILEESRRWNSANTITGMLLYIEGYFVNQYGGRFI